MRRSATQLGMDGVPRVRHLQIRRARQARAPPSRRRTHHNDPKYPAEVSQGSSSWWGSQTARRCTSPPSSPRGFGVSSRVAEDRVGMLVCNARLRHVVRSRRRASRRSSSARSAPAFSTLASRTCSADSRVVSTRSQNVPPGNNFGALREVVHARGRSFSSRARTGVVCGRRAVARSSGSRRSPRVPKLGRGDGPRGLRAERGG